MFRRSRRSGKILSPVKSERTEMPPYFAICIPAISVSISRFEAISHGNVMVGNPIALFPFLSAARRITIWSSKDCFISLDPGSITRSFSPIAVNLSVKGTSPSTESAFTARGRSLSFARVPKSSAFASVAAYIKGRLNLPASMPAFITSAFSDISTRLNSDVSAIVFALFAKASLSPLVSFKATSSGLKFSPTRSNWKAFHTLSFASRSLSEMSELTMAARAV